MIWFIKRRRAQNPDDYETWQQGGVSPTLSSFDNTGSNRATVLVIAFTQNQRDEVRVLGEQAGSLSACSGSHQSNYLLIDSVVVRRLTPVECERLMGWPDDHTLHRADGKTNSDSTRNKMCGNGVATPVARFIAEQLRPFLEAEK